MRETNRELAKRWFDEVWNQRRDETIDELMAPNAVGQMEGAAVEGPAQFKAVRAALLQALGDLHLEVEETAADDDSVVVRWRATGTHTGDGLGIAATQRGVEMRGMTWLKFREGRIVRGWDAWNQGALLESLRSPVGK